MTNALATVAAANALSADISYEQNVVSLVEQFQFGIIASWRKVASSIMETGRLLLQAEAQLDRAGFTAIRKHLVDNGIMSETVISKLLKIARNTVLSAPDNLPLLPASYATLYVLAGKDPADVQNALSEGQITPLTQLRDVTDLFPTQSKKVHKVAVPTGIVVTVQGDLSDVPADKVNEFKAAIEALKEFVTVDVKGL